MEKARERQRCQADETGEYVQVEQPAWRLRAVEQTRQWRQQARQRVRDKSRCGPGVAGFAIGLVQGAAQLHHVRCDRLLQIVKGHAELASPESAQRLELDWISAAVELFGHAVENLWRDDLVRFEQKTCQQNKAQQHDEGRRKRWEWWSKTRAPAPPSEEKECEPEHRHGTEQIAQKEVGVARGLVAREQLQGHDSRQRVHQQQAHEANKHQQVRQPARFVNAVQAALQQHVEKQGAADLEHAPTENCRCRAA